MLTLVSRREVAEAGFRNRTCGHRSIRDAEATVTAGSGEMVQIQTTTIEARFAGFTSTVDIEVGTGVHTGCKGIHPTPNIPRIDRNISEVSRPTATEAGHDKGCS